MNKLTERQQALFSVLKLAFEGCRTHTGSYDNCVKRSWQLAQENKLTITNLRFDRRTIKALEEKGYIKIHAAEVCGNGRFKYTVEILK